MSIGLFFFLSFLSVFMSADANADAVKTYVSQKQSTPECQPIHAVSARKIFQEQELSGKTRVIWFASWCGACRKKIADLSAAELKKTVFVGLLESQAKSSRALKVMLRGRQGTVKLPCYSDSNGQVAELYKVSGLPASTKL